MKKIFILVLFVILSYTAQATAEDFYNKLSVGISGGPGIVLATGFLPDPPLHGVRTTTNVGPGGVIGIFGGYNFFNSTLLKYDHALYAIVGNELAFKTIHIDLEFPHGNGESTYKTSFYNFSCSVRGIVGWLYYEAGLFYGIEMLEWRYHYSGYRYDGDDTTVNRKLYGNESTNELSLLIGFGLAFPVIRNLTLDAGLQFQFGLTSIVESSIPDTDMNEISMLLKLGVTYRFL